MTQQRWMCSMLKWMTQQTGNTQSTVTNSLKVELRGLEYMNDDPAEVDVLYAQVNDKTDR